jgi:hypothetical protein
MKAIQITDENRNSVAAQYLIDGEDANDCLPTGYWLITAFGIGATIEGVVTNDFFVANYEIRETLQNGYVDVIRI